MLFPPGDFDRSKIVNSSCWLSYIGTHSATHNEPKRQSCAKNLKTHRRALQIISNKKQILNGREFAFPHACSTKWFVYRFMTLWHFTSIWVMKQLWTICKYHRFWSSPVMVIRESALASSNVANLHPFDRETSSSFHLETAHQQVVALLNQVLHSLTSWHGQRVGIHQSPLTSM